MSTIKIVSFEHGIERIIKTILTQPSAPTIITIHGVPNSGKTELRRRIFNTLCDTHQVYGWSGIEGDSLEKLSHYGLILNPVYALFECTEVTEPASLYVQDILHKKPDVRVYITKQIIIKGLLAEQVSKGEYTLFIENPQANSQGKLFPH